MKITLNLEADALKAAKQFAKRRSIRLGKAVSELVRRGISVAPATYRVNGLQVVALPTNSPKVTLKAIRELEASQYLRSLPAGWLKRRSG